MSIVEELRSKVSRDNRDLLDHAAAEIEDLKRNLEAAYAKIEALQNLVIDFLAKGVKMTYTEVSV